MQGIAVDIVEYVDDSTPGWVRAVFRDANGSEWSIIEKVPVVSLDFLDAGIQYPVRGFVAGTIIKQFISSSGEKVVTIDLSQPWCIATQEGQETFDIFEKHLLII